MFCCFTQNKIDTIVFSYHHDLKIKTLKLTGSNITTLTVQDLKKWLRRQDSFLTSRYLCLYFNGKIIREDAKLSNLINKTNCDNSSISIYVMTSPL